ncbi:MAG TPA: helix-turn-helix transcriptional regulator, partial [Xanthobacteraceae bacterium]|nr:helix-turn-helix transcriptional regulator [Xanthobacteraceae bacterium]
QAAIAVDRFGAVVDANGAVEEILDDHLYIDQGRRLCAPDAKAGALLQSLFEQLRLAPDDLPIAALPMIVRRGGKGPVVIRVLPVPGAASGPFGGARALLTLTAIEPKPGPDASVISDVFGLTRAESDIAALVAQGRSLAAIADGRGIARVTVRNQLRTIFAKTRTHRQSELVALLSRL